MRLDVFGHSHPGLTRPHNEDDYLCLQPAAQQEVSLLAVADGMGGHAGGATASTLAMQSLRRTITAELGGDDPPRPAWRILERAVEEVNRAIWQAADENPALRGMGTTLVAALVVDRTATVASIGDSRCYHLDRDGLHQITQDHSWAADQLRLGALTIEQIEQSPLRNTITRALGFEQEIEADLFQIELASGDVLLLCSDGAHGLLPDSEIEQIAREFADAETICHQLIERSNASGGTDNITAAVALLLPEGSATPSSATQPIPTLTDDEAKRT